MWGRININFAESSYIFPIIPKLKNSKQVIFTPLIIPVLNRILLYVKIYVWKSFVDECIYAMHYDIEMEYITVVSLKIGPLEIVDYIMILSCNVNLLQT